MPASIPGNVRYSARANQPSTKFDLPSSYSRQTWRNNSAREFSQRSSSNQLMGINPTGGPPIPIRRPHPPVPSFRKAAPGEVTMSTANHFGPISVKTCALVQRPPSSSSSRRRHGWGAAFENTTDDSSAQQQLAPGFGKSTIISFGVAQGKVLAAGSQRSRGLLAHAAVPQDDGICGATQNTTRTSQQSKMETEATGRTPDDGMGARCLPVSPSSAPVAEGVPATTPEFGGESILLESSSEVTAFVKQPRAIHASDPGCRPSAGDPVAAVPPGAKRSTLPSSAEKKAPTSTQGPSASAGRTTSAKIKQQGPPKPKPWAVSAVQNKQQQSRPAIASETRTESTRVSSGQQMPCQSRKPDTATQQKQNQQKELIKGVCMWFYYLCSSVCLPDFVNMSAVAALRVTVPPLSLCCSVSPSCN